MLPRRQLPPTSVASEASQMKDQVPGLSHPVRGGNRTKAFGTLGAKGSATEDEGLDVKSRNSSVTDQLILIKDDGQHLKGAQENNLR